MYTELIEKNLLDVLFEIKKQSKVGVLFSKDEISFDDLVHQINEYIEFAGEYGIAYETLVCTLEKYPFNLSSKNSIKFLEVGLLMGYKTDREEDKMFMSSCD